MYWGWVPSIIASVKAVSKQFKIKYLLVISLSLFRRFIRWVLVSYSPYLYFTDNISPCQGVYQKKWEVFLPPNPFIRFVFGLYLRLPHPESNSPTNHPNPVYPVPYPE
jgi:hypothetical protein